VPLIFNSIFAVFLAVCLSFAASLIGMDARGAESAPQNSAVVRNGLAPQNPALNAFENKTKFGVTIQYEYAEAREGSSAIALNSFTMPSISMVLPLGFLGTFGIGLEQKYFASNRLELADTALDASISLNSRTGLYELAPSYSMRLPSFLSDFALGASYRIFFGNSYSTLERGKSRDWDSEGWMARDVLITERERGSYKASDDWWRNLGYSLHFHRKTTDYFISYFPSLQMEKNIRKNIQFSNTDTLRTTNTTEEFTLSSRFASGVHFRFWQNQNLSLVYEQHEAFSWFAEYKIAGTGLYYSSFLKRNNFGINAWYAKKYTEDAQEYGASLLSDLWMGRRGTLVGLALYGGYRQAEKEEPGWYETFFGFKLNLTGVGNWGTSSRRK
jgi:long-chain fatty acid transport protein